MDISIYMIYIYQKIQDSAKPKLRGNFIVIHLNEEKQENQLDRELEKNATLRKSEKEINKIEIH